MLWCAQTLHQLSPLSISAVSFMQESSFNVQTRESQHRYKNDTTEEVSAFCYLVHIH